MRVVSEGPVKITRATIDSAWKRREKGVRLMVRDAQCRGLALVVNPTGMSWRYDYRPRGRNPDTGKRWPGASVTIGNPSTHNPDEARHEANRIKGRPPGVDPAAERRAAAAAERRRHASTFARLLDAYEAVLPTRPKLRGTGLPTAKHAAEEAAHARAAVAAMGVQGRPVAALGVADVRAWLATEGRPATARARFGALSRFLDWCVDAEHLQVNPCAAVVRARRPRAVPSRGHFLRPAELARLWRAAEAFAAGGRKAGPTHRDLARFLIAVPCRRGEAAALDWSHLDLLAAEWSQPGALTKNGEPHRLHLHPLALELLRARHKAVGRPAEGTVFPSVRTGKPFDAWTRMKARLEAETGLKGWRWHDFRRSFATALGEAGTQETVADAVLNHKQAATRAGVLSTYQRSVRWPEQVEAMQAWGAILAAAVVPGGGGQTGAGGNVVASPTPVRRGAKGRKA